MARLLFLLITSISLGLAASARAEQVGRLFFSTDERAMLEQQRQKGDTSHTVSEQITLTGFIRRSSGKTTTWINQMPQNENEAPQGITVLGSTARPPATSDSARTPTRDGTRSRGGSEPPLGVPLLLPSGKKLDLKAGQTYDTASGKVREVYESNTIPDDSPRVPDQSGPESFRALPRETAK